jgi:uncharacterized protein
MQSVQIRESDIIDNESYNVIKGTGYLVISKVNSAWCVLNDRSLRTFKEMSGVSFLELTNKLNLEDSQLLQFIQELYQYGVISINGKRAGRVKLEDSNYPLSLLVLKITNNCNMWCKYCYNEGVDNADNMDVATASRTIASALEACQNGVNIVFHGGEPFLQFSLIKDTVSFAKQKAAELNKKVYFNVQTNATLFTEEILDFIKKEKMGMGISLDGPVEYNDKTRIWADGGGTFNDIYRGLIYTKSKGIPLNLITVVTSTNERHLSNIVKFFQSIGARSIKFSFFFKQGRGILYKDLGTSPEGVVHSFKEIVDCIVRKEIWNIEVNDIIYLIRNVILRDGQSMCHRSPCGAGKDMLAVYPSGKIYACDCLVHPDFELGNIRDISLKGLRGHSIVKKLEQRVVDNLLPCHDCLVKNICGGTMTCRAFWSSERIDTIDSNECFVNQTMIEYLMWSLTDHPELLEYFLKFNGKEPSNSTKINESF